MTDSLKRLHRAMSQTKREMIPYNRTICPWSTKLDVGHCCI
jgi:hypothetical protein